VLEAAIETALPVIEQHRHHFEQRRSAAPIWIEGTWRACLESLPTF
jgi:hypothetical protein